MFRTPKEIYSSFLGIRCNALACCTSTKFLCPNTKSSKI